MSRWNVSNDEYNKRSSIGLNDMLPVAVNGKNVFTDLKSVLRLRGHAHKDALLKVRYLEIKE